MHKSWFSKAFSVAAKCCLAIFASILTGCPANEPASVNPTADVVLPQGNIMTALSAFNDDVLWAGSEVSFFAADGTFVGAIAPEEGIISIPPEAESATSSLEFEATGRQSTEWLAGETRLGSGTFVVTAGEDGMQLILDGSEYEMAPLESINIESTEETTINGSGAYAFASTVAAPEVNEKACEPQCVNYVRNRLLAQGYSTSTMPSIGYARNAWTGWNFGYGKGMISPQPNSVAVLDAWGSNAAGHVFMVTSVTFLPNSTGGGVFRLTADESNWDNNCGVTTNVSYTFDPATKTVTRGSGTTKYPCRGFVFTRSPRFLVAGVITAPAGYTYGWPSVSVGGVGASVARVSGYTNKWRYVASGLLYQTAIWRVSVSGCVSRSGALEIPENRLNYNILMSR